MKKRLQKFGEEIVPLSRKQSILLFLLIACVFQFVLFFTPALAAETVAAQDNEISLGSVNKSLEMDQDAQNIANSTVITENKTITPITASSTPVEVKVKSTSVHVITAYNSDAAQTDDSPCITANGFNVCEHGQEDTIAANFLKFGTKVKIPDLYGDRVFVVRDRMNVKHPSRVDIWMKDRPSAIKFGVKTAKIQVLE
jgi:3D (Asp-Asp-Asp) domain-containing protein